MKIALLESYVETAPRPGTDELIGALQANGHEVERIRIPFAACPPERIADQVLAVRLMRLEIADRAIALSFPAGYMPHGNKIAWVSDRQGRLAGADRAFLKEAVSVRAGSREIAERLRDEAGITSEILYWPPSGAQDGYRDHLVAFSTAPAILEAFALAPGALRLYGNLSPALLSRAVQLGVAGRIEPLGDGARRGEALASARAVLVDGDDDAGVIEASAARKAVVAIEPSRTQNGGLEPQREARSIGELAEAIGELAADRSLAERLGASAAKRLEDVDLSWEHVAAELTR